MIWIDSISHLHYVGKLVNSPRKLEYFRRIQHFIPKTQHLKFWKWPSGNLPTYQVQLNWVGSFFLWRHTYTIRVLIFFSNIARTKSLTLYNNRGEILLSNKSTYISAESVSFRHLRRAMSLTDTLDFIDSFEPQIILL